MREYIIANYQIDFIKDDYNPGHVIEVIAAKKYGVKCIGVQHTGSLYEAPQIGFAYMDKYIVFGEMYVRMFEDFWDKSMLEKLGRESIEWTQKISVIEKKTNKIKRSVSSNYGEYEYCITILFPGISKICCEDKWEEMVAALKELATYQDNFKIFGSLHTLL